MKQNTINRTNIQDRDKWFAGWKDFASLSNLVMEDEEEDAEEEDE